MENVLDLYHRPEAAAHPLVCVDETSKQHIREVRQPLGASKVHRADMILNTRVMVLAIYS